MHDCSITTNTAFAINDSATFTHLLSDDAIHYAFLKVPVSVHPSEALMLSSVTSVRCHAATTDHSRCRRSPELLQRSQLLADILHVRSMGHKPIMRIHLVESVCRSCQALRHRLPSRLARQVLVPRRFVGQGLLVGGTPPLGWEPVVFRALRQAGRVLVVATAASKDAATSGAEMVLAIVNCVRATYLRILAHTKPSGSQSMLLLMNAGLLVVCAPSLIGLRRRRTLPLAEGGSHRKVLTCTRTT